MTNNTPARSTAYQIYEANSTRLMALAHLQHSSTMEVTTRINKLVADTKEKVHKLLAKKPLGDGVQVESLTVQLNDVQASLVQQSEMIDLLKEQSCLPPDAIEDIRTTVDHTQYPQKWQPPYLDSKTQEVWCFWVPNRYW